MPQNHGHIDPPVALIRDDIYQEYLPNLSKVIIFYHRKHQQHILESKTCLFLLFPFPDAKSYVIQTVLKC